MRGDFPHWKKKWDNLEFLSEETGRMANSNTRKHHIGEKEDDSDLTMSRPSRGIKINATKSPLKLGDEVTPRGATLPFIEGQ